jgi:hypothetical protein
MANFKQLPFSLFLEDLFSQVSEYGSTIVGVDLQIAPEANDTGVPLYLEQLAEFADPIDDKVSFGISKTKPRKGSKRQSTKPYVRSNITRSNVPQDTLPYDDFAKAGLVARLKNAKCQGQSVRTVIKPLILSHLEVYILSEVGKKKIVANMVKMLKCPDHE